MLAISTFTLLSFLFHVFFCARARVLGWSYVVLPSEHRFFPILFSVESYICLIVVIVIVIAVAEQRRTKHEKYNLISCNKHQPKWAVPLRDLNNRRRREREKRKWKEGAQGFFLFPQKKKCWRIRKEDLLARKKVIVSEDLQESRKEKVNYTSFSLSAWMRKRKKCLKFKHTKVETDKFHFLLGGGSGSLAQFLCLFWIYERSIKNNIVSMEIEFYSFHLSIVFVSLGFSIFISTFHSSSVSFFFATFFFTLEVSRSKRKRRIQIKATSAYFSLSIWIRS